MTHCMWGVTEKQAEQMFQCSTHLICLTQFGGNFLRLNEKWKTILGWEIPELLNTPYIEFIHPDDKQKTIEYEKNFIPTEFRNRFRAKDGTYRYFQWIGLSQITDEPNVPPGSVLSIVLDVTVEELLKSEKEEKISLLNEHLQFKSNVLQSIVDIQWIYTGSLGSGDCGKGTDLSFQHIIDHFVRLTSSEFGFLAEVGQNKEILSFRYYSLGEQCLKRNESIERITEKALQSGEIQMVNNTKSDTINCFAAIPLIVNPEMVGIIGLANRKYGYTALLLEWLQPLFIISARIVNEVKLRRCQQQAKQEKKARKRAEAANNAKSAFLAHMSHELRTPLSGIIGLIDLANENDNNEENQTYLALAKESAKNLLSILNDILDLSKIEERRLVLEHVEFSPFKVAQEVRQLMLCEAVKKHIPLELTMNPQIPPLVIGDSLRFRQILLNLVGNAIKFTNSGSVSIFFNGEPISCSENHGDNTNENQYMIQGFVKDTGIGINPEHQKLLFQPFVQADNGMARQFGGTGLGLYITKQLCHLMNGDAWVESTEGIGSTFYFNICVSLPKTINSQIEEDDTWNQELQLPPLRILVAEDNSVNRLVIQKMLKKSGCTDITEVVTGRAALEAVQGGEYDLVLMDGEMPEMDGIEATRLIRQLFDACTLPIIGITAHAMSGDCEKFLNAGMNACITKPVTKETLVREIQAICHPKSKKQKLN